MYTNLCPLPSAIADILAEAVEGRLTLADRYGLKALLLQDRLDREEQDAIDRLLYSVRRGRLGFESC